MSGSCGHFCKHEFRKYHLSLDYVSPYDFVTFQCGFHKVYLCWRIFWALYHIVWIILTGVYSYQWAGDDPAQQVKWFIYLTDWAYFVLTVSTVIDAICVVFISMRRDDILQDICPIMPWYLKVDWVFFNVSNSISILMSLMYWALIYSSSEEMTAVNIETHALNMVYVLINLFMTGIPVRFYHFFHPMIFGILYVIFSVIYEVSGGTNHKNKTYIYSVLDWSNTTYTLMVSLIVVLVAIPVCHFVLFLFHLIRIYLNKKCCSRHKRSCTIVTPNQQGNSQEKGSELNSHSDVKIPMDSKAETDTIESFTVELGKENGNVNENKQKTVKDSKMDSEPDIISDLEDKKEKVVVDTNEKSK